MNEEVARVFYMFCEREQTKLDKGKFVKICQDCGLLDRTFTRADADNIVIKVLRRDTGTSGKGRMDLWGFEAALRLVAEKKGEGIDAIYQAIAESSGPSMNFTKASSNRFHDDRSTYTGTHREGGPDMGRKFAGQGFSNADVIALGLRDGKK